MFSYVDESVRRELESDGLLVTIDRLARQVESSDRSAFMSLLGPVPLPRLVGGEEVTLDWYPFVRRTELSHVLEAASSIREGDSEAFRELLQSSMSVNSLLALPGFLEAEQPLVRLHSSCLTGDVFGSRRCDCGPQLELAFQRILAEGTGAVVYMSGHEGRGIGLWAKAITYLLQDSGHDTYQANTALGLPEDSRDFTDAAVLLRHLLHGRSIRLLSNNPEKRQQLESHGQEVSAILPLIAGVCEHNSRYLEAKKGKGHLIPDELPGS